MTLNEVLAPLLAFLLIVGGLALIAFALRLAKGSSEAYDQLRGVSKGVMPTLFGDLRQPNGKGGILYNRGAAFSVDGHGNIELLSQAKTNRESVKDSSI